MSRPDCYACRYRAAVPGDAHSECRRPGLNLESGLAFMMHAMAELVRPDAPEAITLKVGHPEVEVTFASHGVRNGWATWPMNYDPTWLRACSGFASPERRNEA